MAYLETGVFIVVAMALKRIPATLIQRIRRARSVMGEAEQGSLAVRAAATEADELGFLEKSFNRMLEEIGSNNRLAVDANGRLVPVDVGISNTVLSSTRFSMPGTL